MPRFYFSFASEPEMVDDEGIEFVDAAAARSEAICCVGEMLRDQSSRSAAGRDWQLAVSDDTGARVARVSVSVE